VSPAVVIDLRQRRRDAVAEVIEREAIEAFAARGFDAVTVDDIARAAGISPRTFFRYFPSKADVVRAQQRRILDRLVRALAARPRDEGPVVALREALLTTARLRPEDRDRTVLVGRVLATAREGGVLDVGFEAERNRELVRLVGARFGRSATKSAGRRAEPHQLRAAVLVAAMTAAAQVAFRAWLDAGGRIELEAIMAEGLALLEAGLATLDPGARRPARREGGKR